MSMDPETVNVPDNEGAAAENTAGAAGTAAGVTAASAAAAPAAATTAAGAEKRTFKSVFLAVLFCALGSLFVAFALNQVLKPAGFSPGGVTGLSVLVNKVTDNLIPVGVAQIVMNIPLFIWGYKTLGKEFIFRSIMGTLMTSIFDAYRLNAMFPTSVSSRPMRFSCVKL